MIIDQVDLAYFSFKPMPPSDTPHFEIRIDDKGNAKRKTIKALMPFAKAFDIITFSIQFIIVEGIL